MLRLNWILPAANMAGGAKSNRLIAEAMIRRGHTVNMAYATRNRVWPGPWRPRRFAKRLWREARLVGRQRHHLESSSTNLISVPRRCVLPQDVPDADVTIATWWETREWIETWPPAKGVKAYFVRGYEIHGGDPDRVRATYRMAGPKFVTSTWLRRLMANEFGDPNAVLVPNGVDWNQFDSDPREKAPVPTVGLTYAPRRIKGMDTAMEALHLVGRRLPELQIIAFGSEPVGRRHRPPPKMKLFLRPAQQRIEALYRKTDCWLISSTYEGFGMPGLEAAACRCPIVSTRCGGPEDYVADGVSGHLVPVGDVEALAEAIVKVLTLDSASWRAMSEASYAMARRFDWDQSARILESTLLQAVDHHAALQAGCTSVAKDKRT
jgi:glycosyltransferase involved in cell wall biosynthesis